MRKEKYLYEETKKNERPNCQSKIVKAVTSMKYILNCNKKFIQYNLRKYVSINDERKKTEF